MRPSDVVVTDADIDAYTKDGVVHLKGVFDPSWVAHVSDAVDALHAAPGDFAKIWRTDERQSEFYEEPEVARRSPAIVDYIERSPAAEIAAQIMRAARVYCIYDQVFIKQPGEIVKGTDWHQDMPYMPFTGEQLCVMWMPLEYVARENSLEFVRGSHASEQLYHFSTPGHGKLNLPPMPDIEGAREEYDIVSFECDPGDVVIFHMRTLHGAATRRNVETRRRTLSTRWAGENVRYHLDNRLSAIRTPIPLEPGDPVACEKFPQVWPRDATA